MHRGASYALFNFVASVSAAHGSHHGSEGAATAPTNLIANESTDQATSNCAYTGGLRLLLQGLNSDDCHPV
jgi:hypothetical protein